MEAKTGGQEATSLRPPLEPARSSLSTLEPVQRRKLSGFICFAKKKLLFHKTKSSVRKPNITGLPTTPQCGTSALLAGSAGRADPGISEKTRLGVEMKTICSEKGKQDMALRRMKGVVGTYQASSSPMTSTETSSAQAVLTSRHLAGRKG